MITASWTPMNDSSNPSTQTADEASEIVVIDTPRRRRNPIKFELPERAVDWSKVLDLTPDLFVLAATLAYVASFEARIKGQVQA